MHLSHARTHTHLHTFTGLQLMDGRYGGCGRLLLLQYPGQRPEDVVREVVEEHARHHLQLGKVFGPVRSRNE